MRDLDEPLYTVAQAAQVCGLASVSTLRSWLQTGIISLGKSDTGASQGGTRKLSHRRVLQVAVMTDLTGIGVAPARAARLAFGFSDVGTGAGPDNGMVQRIAGEVYPEPFTVLVAHLHTDVPRIMWARNGTPAVSMMFSQSAPGMLPGLFLPLDPVVKRVHFGLGLND